MKSIIWKDFFEYRWHLIIMMAYGLVALALLNHYRVLDTSTVIFLLFIFAGPPFALFMGLSLVEREVSHGTFPFLAALPLQRSTIWWGKLGFGVLFISALYLFFLLISIVANASVLTETDFTFYIKNLPKIPVFQILFGLPAIFLSVGMFATMLPSVVSLIVMGFFSAGLVTIIFTGMYFTTNCILISWLLTGSFLLASRMAFVHGELMNSGKRITWGMVGLAAGLILSVGIWAGLDHLSETSYTINPLGRSPIQEFFVESVSSVILSPVTLPAWYDPIQIPLPHRIFRMNTLTAGLEQIGRRMTFTRLRSPDKRFLAATTDLWWYGAFGKSKLVLIDLFQQNQQTFVDEDSFPLSFTNEGGLIYERSIQGKDNQIREYAVFDAASGSRVLHSISDLQVQRPAFLPEVDSLLFNKRGTSTPPYTVNIKTGAVKKLDVPCPLRYSGTLASKSLLTNKMENSAAHFYTLDKEGHLEALTWISSSTEIIHSFQDGRVLAITNQRSNKDLNQTDQVDLIIIDGQSKTIQTFVHLEKFPSWGRTMIVDTQEKTMLLRLYDDNGSGIWGLDLANAQLKKFPFSMINLRNAISNGPGKFITHENASLWEVDLNRNERRKIMDF